MAISGRWHKTLRNFLLPATLFALGLLVIPDGAFARGGFGGGGFGGGGFGGGGSGGGSAVVGDDSVAAASAAAAWAASVTRAGILAQATTGAPEIGGGELNPVISPQTARTSPRTGSRG